MGKQDDRVLSHVMRQPCPGGPLCNGDSVPRVDSSCAFLASSLSQQPVLNAVATVNSKSQRWLVPCLCLVLAAITFAVFGQTLHHEFVNYDDDDYVYANPVVAQGLTRKGIAWAFTHVHASNWHPLTSLSHELDCQLYRLNPGGHHLTSVLLHIATVIALFLVLRAMTGALWRSAFVAAVFAIHPLRVESVAWVAERKDVLSGLFFMLTIGAYVRYARRPWLLARYGLVVLLFALGLMCKPMLVTLPLILLLLDYWPLQRKESAGKLALEKLPLLALSAVSCAVTLLVQHEAIQSTGVFSLPVRFVNALLACEIYLRQMIYPAGLAAYYPYSRHGVPGLETAIAAMLSAVFSVVAWRMRRTQPWLLTGWAWYLVMLIPVVGIVQVGGQAHADRYTYLPQIGIYVGLTWLVAKWRLSRVALTGLMAGVLAVLMACAWKQSAYWQNSESLWTHTLACTTDNCLANYNLGLALEYKGRLNEAINHYRMAVEINPNYAEAHNNLGTALFQQGKTDAAIPHFQEALKIKPHFADAHYNLGNALLQNGDADEAITQFQAAVQIDPGYAPAHNNLGDALLQKGSLEEAIAQYQTALQINPDNANAHANLGIAFQQIGRMDEASTHLEKALQIDPAKPAFQNNLAWFLATCPKTSLRNGKKAVELARQANALTGRENPIILQTLAAAFAEAGQFNDAVNTVQKAIELTGTAGQQNLAARLEGELKQYEAGLTIHQ